MNYLGLGSEEDQRVEVEVPVGARREVLLKEDVQGVPTYAMQFVEIPKVVCDQIERICHSFWWGQDLGKLSMLGLGRTHYASSRAMVAWGSNNSIVLTKCF